MHYVNWLLMVHGGCADTFCAKASADMRIIGQFQWVASFTIDIDRRDGGALPLEAPALEPVRGDAVVVSQHRHLAARVHYRTRVAQVGAREQPAMLRTVSSLKSCAEPHA